MKQLLKELLPPFLFRLIQSACSAWKGDYPTWEAAKKDCQGYDCKNILKQVSDATAKVASGECAYERDSVLFDKVEYSWPLATALLYLSQKAGRLNVLDLGGGLGSTFFQNKLFLDSVRELKWTVVEQEHFVQEGKKRFETDRLKFALNIPEVMNSGEVNFILLSSVLQYLPDPYSVLKEILGLGPEIIFIDRLSVVEGDHDIITKQTVPKKIYKANYPSRFFSEKNITNVFKDQYELVSDFEAYIPNVGLLNFKHRYQDKGFFYKVKK